jgi:hypothetical protein
LLCPRIYFGVVLVLYPGVAQVGLTAVCTVVFPLLRLLRSGTQINETGC